MRTSEFLWVKGLLKRIPKEMRKEVLANLSKVRKELPNEEHYADPYVTSIKTAFVWNVTSLGFTYWSDLYELAYGD